MKAAFSNENATYKVLANENVGGSHETRSARVRWGNHEDLFADGFLVVPHRFLRTYAALQPPLTHGEALFVLHLMSHKWDEAHPYPSYGTLAKLMGVDEKTVQRYAQSLCRKKYLFRVFQTKGSNRFDLTPLFNALLRTARPLVKERVTPEQAPDYQSVLD